MTSDKYDRLVKRMAYLLVEQAMRMYSLQVRRVVDGETVLVWDQFEKDNLETALGKLRGSET